MLYNALQCCLEGGEALGRFSQCDPEEREVAKNISFQSSFSPDLSLEIIKEPLPLLESRETLEIFSHPFIISLINPFEILLYFFKKEKTCFWLLFASWEMRLLNLGALIQFLLTGHVRGYRLSSLSAVTEAFSTT